MLINTKAVIDTGIPNVVRDYGCNQALADNSGRLQQALDDIPQSFVGGAIYVPAGRYRFTSAINLIDKLGISIICEPSVSFNEDTATPVGTAFIANTAGMTLFDCGSSGAIQHHGPQFLGNPHFVSLQNNVTLVKLYSVNHWYLDRPNFQSAAGITGVNGVTIDHAGGANDNAYGMFMKPNFNLSGSSCVGVNALKCNNYNMMGGNFNMGGGGTTYGIKLINTQQCMHFGVKQNWATVTASPNSRHVYCEGGNNEFIGCGFENNPLGSGAGAWTIEIVRILGANAAGRNTSGYNNKLIGGIVSGDGTVGGIKLLNNDSATTNAYDNVLDCTFSNLSPLVSIGAGVLRTAQRSTQLRSALVDGSSVNAVLAELRTYGVLLP